MIETIPTYHIENFPNMSESKGSVFFSDHKEKPPKFKINIPYRSNYYGVSICIKGKATLKANLKTYTVEGDCIVTMSPQIVKQWLEIDDNYETLTIFFTKEFLLQTTHPDDFPFFNAEAKHVSKYTPDQCKSIIDLFHTIQVKYNSDHPYRKEILKNLISNLLFELAAIYIKEIATFFHNQTRSQQITTSFKNLVCEHYVKQRSVKFYAEQLFVTAKHLTETIKAETGKSAGEWIDETIILESKILLQNASISISQVADKMNFKDTSTFGKFFKNLTGMSPLSYRHSL